MIADHEIRAVTNATGVAAAVERIYGAPLEAMRGVLHVTAVWRDPGGTLITLNVNDQTPRCDHDAFALGVARARADAIVTTGRVLRAEPALSHALPGPAKLPAALADWRRSLGKRKPPLSVILTRSGDVDFDHPLFGGGHRAVLYTSEETAERLRSRAAERGVGVIADRSPSLRQAIARLEGQGIDGVAIEAGPSTARTLYQAPLAVDELMLSIFEAPDLAPEVRGGALGTEAMLDAHLPHRSPPYAVATRDGNWSFSRRLR
ncbi:MAG: hypothetical protein D6696_02135 [Acidobacteria bacterium]|nr:MAG: hypothetical protein D6696_02135 [Acidobacteriota bacterium]